jgi:hypothetical protein
MKRPLIRTSGPRWLRQTRRREEGARQWREVSAGPGHGARCGNMRVGNCAAHGCVVESWNGICEVRVCSVMVHTRTPNVRTEREESSRSRQPCRNNTRRTQGRSLIPRTQVTAVEGGRVQGRKAATLMRHPCHTQDGLIVCQRGTGYGTMT